MKKYFLIVAMQFALLTHGQLKQTAKPQSILPSKPQKLAPVPLSDRKDTTPAYSVKSKDAYYLRAATVVIQTGNDNKEMLSTVSFTLFRKGDNITATSSGESELPLFSISSARLQNQVEFRINSSNDINLQSLFSPEYRFQELELAAIEKRGLKLVIEYNPELPEDLWMIEKISLVLRVQDANGKPHPKLDYKIIRFAKSQLLSGRNRKIILETDGALNSKV